MGVEGPTSPPGPRASLAERAERRFALRLRGYEIWSHLWQLHPGKGEPSSSLRACKDSSDQRSHARCQHSIKTNDLCFKENDLFIDIFTSLKKYFSF